MLADNAILTGVENLFSPGRRIKSNLSKILVPKAALTDICVKSIAENKDLHTLNYFISANNIELMTSD